MAHSKGSPRGPQSIPRPQVLWCVEVQQLGMQIRGPRQQSTPGLLVRQDARRWGAG
jgi:hypothetical protein